MPVVGSLQIDRVFLVAEFRGDHEEDDQRQNDVDHRSQIELRLFEGKGFDWHLTDSETDETQTADV
ncbi:MAG: hypothetical protein QM811_10335 [Pirellulales bacterium]